MAKVGRVCKFCLGKRSHGLSEKAIRNCGEFHRSGNERTQQRASRKVARRGGRWVKTPTVSSQAWRQLNRRQ